MTHRDLLRVAAAMLLTWACIARCEAQVAPRKTSIDGEPVKSVLWVGNSFFYFNNGIVSSMSQLSAGAGQGARATRR
jgi:hypothetical protein